MTRLATSPRRPAPRRTHSEGASTCPVCATVVASRTVQFYLHRLDYHVAPAPEHADGSGVACRGAGRVVRLVGRRGL